MLDEGREILSPLHAPPTVCVISHRLLMLEFHSKLSLLAHALEQGQPGKESFREDGATGKQFFVLAHCLKQRAEHHRWNCRQKEPLEENASFT